MSESLKRRQIAIEFALYNCELVIWKNVPLILPATFQWVFFLQWTNGFGIDQSHHKLLNTFEMCNMAKHINTYHHIPHTLDSVILNLTLGKSWFIYPMALVISCYSILSHDVDITHAYASLNYTVFEYKMNWVCNIHIGISGCDISIPTYEINTQYIREDYILNCGQFYNLQWSVWGAN